MEEVRKISKKISKEKKDKLKEVKIEQKFKNSRCFSQSLLYKKKLADEIRKFNIELKSKDLTIENEYRALIVLEEAIIISLENDSDEKEFEEQIQTLKNFNFIDSAEFIKMIKITEYISKHAEVEDATKTVMGELVKSDDYLQAIKHIDEKKLSSEQQNIVDELCNNLIVKIMHINDNKI